MSSRLWRRRRFSQTRQGSRLVDIFQLLTWLFPDLVSVLKSKRVKATDVNEEHVVRPTQLLWDKLIKRAGYSTFKAFAHKTLQNPDIPSNWEFAAKFSTDFHGKSIGESVSRPCHVLSILVWPIMVLVEFACHESHDLHCPWLWGDLAGQCWEGSPTGEEVWEGWRARSGGGGAWNIHQARLTCRK